MISQAPFCIWAVAVCSVLKVPEVGHYRGRASQLVANGRDLEGYGVLKKFMQLLCRNCETIVQ